MAKKLLFVSMVLGFSIFSYGQSWQTPLIGKWKTKNEAVLEFYKCGQELCARQLSAKREKDKGGVGRNVVKNLKRTDDNAFEGVLYIPSRDAEHKAKWVLSPDQKTLTVKVKWLMLSYQEDWQKL